MLQEGDTADVGTGSPRTGRLRKVPGAHAGAKRGAAAILRQPALLGPVGGAPRARRDRHMPALRNQGVRPMQGPRAPRRMRGERAGGAGEQGRVEGVPALRTDGG